MILFLENKINDEDKTGLTRYLTDRGCRVREAPHGTELMLLVDGGDEIDPRAIKAFGGVARLIEVKKPYKLASRASKKDDTLVDVNGVIIGAGRLAVIGGPCAVESRRQIMESARIIYETGAVMLRGGAYKPRTSPYAFQGLGDKGLDLLKEAGEKYGLPVVTEIVDGSLAVNMADRVDIFQIGARNMQNFELLKKVGSLKKPVIVKRGIAATIEEWLMAAEYLMAHGAEEVIFCERGIRTFESYTRNTLDLSAIPIIKHLSHLPIIVDPCHATGNRAHVASMALAGAAAGADGLIVEVHPNPDRALSDGPQSLFKEQFEKLIRDLDAFCPVLKKELERLPVERRLRRNIAVKKDRKEGLAVAFQGERGAFSEKALFAYFQEKNIKPRACPSFRDVFKAVLSASVDYGVIPVENSLAGSIHENYDLFMEFVDITIIGEKKLRVEHCLLGDPEARLGDIRQIFSHPQALAQCSLFLKTNSDWRVAPYYDTAGSAALVAQKRDKTIGAVAGAEAALFYKLNILKEGIENNPQNYTRFFVIARHGHPVSTKNNKVSIIYSTPDKPGALYKSLQVLTDHGVNMTKLESRPLPGKPWQYMFYLDLEVPAEDKALEKGLASLKEVTEDLRILGFYSAS